MRFRVFLSLFFSLNLLILSAQDSLRFQSDTLVLIPASPTDSMLALARKHLGAPYRLGGHSRSGFDCSGFVHYLYQHFDVDLAYSCQGIAQHCDKIERSQVQKGDLIFFKGRNIKSRALGHVSVVSRVDSSGIQMIHATRRGVVQDELFRSSYYKPRLLFYARPRKNLALP
ncbi:MAG: C40 family peptidase [Cytophagaceae bacterium]|jgi:cell wall-associated NlpC family hydrolase|nr:C40 family peptidase [Cytophagaceae bacterium]